MWTGKPERAAYEVISCAACFSFHRKLCFYEMKNATRGAHCGRLEDVMSLKRPAGKVRRTK